MTTVLMANLWSLYSFYRIPKDGNEKKTWSLKAGAVCNGKGQQLDREDDRW